jgi:hypothetical protein
MWVWQESGRSVRLCSYQVSGFNPAMRKPCLNFRLMIAKLVTVSLVLINKREFHRL